MSSDSSVLIIHHSIIISEWIGVLLYKMCRDTACIELAEDVISAKRMIHNDHEIVIMEIGLSKTYDKMIPTAQCNKMFLIGDNSEQAEYADKIMDKYDKIDISYYNRNYFIKSLRDIIKQEKLLCHRE